MADPRPRLAAGRSRPTTRPGPNHRDEYLPYLRDERLIRPWAIPGTEGLEHRIGGLEQENVTGDISYDPENHETMTRIRQRKIERMAEDLPPLEVEETPTRTRSCSAEVHGRDHSGGRSAPVRAQEPRRRHRAPRPSEPVAVEPRRDPARGYRKVLIPEMNTGQLSVIVRSKFLVDAVGYNKVQGLPIFAEELEQEIPQVLDA